MALEIGIISLIYNAGKDLVRGTVGLFKKKSIEEIIAHRQKWKKGFDSHLRWVDDIVGYGEVIIRDVKRIDSYPNIDEKGKGISAWFRVGLLGLYHRGVQVGRTGNLSPYK